MTFLRWDWQIHFLPPHLSRSNNRLVTGLILVLAWILVPFRSEYTTTTTTTNGRIIYKSHFTAIPSAPEENILYIILGHSSSFRRPNPRECVIVC